MCVSTFGDVLRRFGRVSDVRLACGRFCCFFFSTRPARVSLVRYQCYNTVKCPVPQTLLVRKHADDDDGQSDTTNQYQDIGPSGE